MSLMIAEKPMPVGTGLILKDAEHLGKWIHWAYTIVGYNQDGIWIQCDHCDDRTCESASEVRNRYLKTFSTILD